MAYETEIQELETQANVLLDKVKELKQKAAREEEEARKTGLLWKPKLGELFFRIYQAPETGCIKTFGHEGGFHYTPQCPVFRTQDQAKAFADAFQVMLELRAQPGIINPTPKIWAHFICYDRTLGAIVYSYSSSSEGFSPAFANRECADAAMKNVGKGRIEAAFKTLLFID